MLLSEFNTNDCSPILSTENMRALDSASKKIMAELGDLNKETRQDASDEILAGYELMKEAGAALFKRISEIASSSKDTNFKVAIFIGGGNNGGDGLVLARLMQEHGIPFKAYTLANPEKFRNEAKLAYSDYLADQGRLIEIDEKDWPIFSHKPNFSLIVDCMLGNGAKGELRPVFAQVVREMNSWNIPVLAADTPTGYDSLVHQAQPTCLHAQETMLFGLPRLDAYTREGSVFGRAVVAPLHYPAELIQKYSDKTFLASEKMISQLLPARDEFGDKRAQGCAMIVAGSLNMTGAAALCTGAALRSGVGLATLAAPQSIQPILQSKLLEPVFRGMPDQGTGFLQPGNVPLLLQRAARNEAVAIGPGLSSENSVKETILEFLSKLDDIPVVIDADALNAVAQEPGIMQAITAPAILTPHVREWERLFGELPENTTDYTEVVRNRSMQTGKVLLLKGAPTFVGIPDGRVYVIAAANSGMAKGGSGDVLSGIIVALLAQGIPTAEAAVLGALLHSKAGHLAREQKGAFSMLPSDIIECLPQAFSV